MPDDLNVNLTSNEK
jgi:hypothetical protein